MDLHGMMRTTDHPLSAKGREQVGVTGTGDGAEGGGRNDT